MRKKWSSKKKRKKTESELLAKMAEFEKEKKIFEQSLEEFKDMQKNFNEDKKKFETVRLEELKKIENLREELLREKSEPPQKTVKEISTKVEETKEKVTEKNLVETSEEKNRMDIEEIRKIEDQHSEIQKEIDNLKKKLTEKNQKWIEAQKLALKSKLGNLGGNGDLISVIAEIVREEIVAQENQRKVKENGGVGTQISSQISELDSKVNTISLQYQKLENTLRFCESEITEVKNHIEEENDHHKTSIQKALRSISEEIDIKLHQFSLVNSPRNPELGLFSTVETKKEQEQEQEQQQPHPQQQQPQQQQPQQQQQPSEDKLAKEEAQKIEEDKKKEEERKIEEDKKRKEEERKIEEDKKRKEEERKNAEDKKRKEEERKNPEEQKKTEKSRVPAPLAEKLPDLPKTAITSIFDNQLHKKPPKGSQNPNDFAGGFFDNPYLEVGDKKMTKPLTQTSLFDDDDNEPLKDNSRPSDIFGKPKTSETNSDKKKRPILQFLMMTTKILL